jgi:hypothetical protein
MVKVYLKIYNCPIIQYGGSIQLHPYLQQVIVVGVSYYIYELGYFHLAGTII